MTSKSRTPRTRIELLGGFRVSPTAGSTELRSRKARAVLAYVAAHPERPPTREKLAGLIWPDSSAENARGSLRQAFYVLRQALPDGVLDTDGDVAKLQGADVDVHEFGDLLEQTSHTAVRRVLELYRGDFLDGFYVDSPEFETWVGMRRRRLREQTITMLDRAMLELVDDHRDVAIDAGLHIVALEPLREDVHRELMKLYADQGRVDAALRQYRMCEETVQRELGVEPAPQTTALRNEIADRAASPAPTTPESSRRLCSMTAVVAGRPTGEGAADADWDDSFTDDLRAAMEQFDCELVPGLPGTVVGCFGLRRPRARDVENAATAALVLRDRFEAAVSIGLESGEAVVTRRADELDLAGGPVGPAARLQAVAPSRTIRIGPRARRSLSERFQLRSQHDSEAYLDELRTDTFSALGGPFVGRTMERDVVARVLDSARESAAAVVIYGAAGIGKSRLLDEALQVTAPHRLYRASGQPSGGGVAADPVASLACEIVREEDELLDDLEPEGRRMVRRFCSADDPEEASSDPVSLLEQRVEAARLVFDYVARRDPVVVAIDDAHACSGSTYRELSEIAASLRDRPFALLLTGRHSLASFEPRIPTIKLQLAPLDDESARVLARELAVDDMEAERCVDRAGGNPLFLERLAVLGPDEELPHTVQSTVLAAVARCPDEQRRALEGAAVLGSPFSAGTLSHVLDSPVEAGSLLATGLVRMVGSGRYAFVHSIARDAIERATDPERAALLHRRAAECFPDQPAVRARHLEHAESPDAAAAYLEAAQRRLANGRWSDAQRLAERGMKIASGRDRWELEAVDARALRLAGRLQRAAEMFHDLARRATDPEAEARARIGIAEALRDRNHPDGALRTLKLAEPLARSDGQQQLLGRVHYLRGSIYFQTGKIDDCAAEHRKALEIAQSRGDRHAEAQALSGLGDALYMGGAMAEAGDRFDECVRLARGAGYRHIELANLYMLGLTHFYRCDIDRALGDVYEALRGARQSASRRSEMVAANSACDVLSFTADWPALHDVARRALGAAHRLGSAQFQALSRAYRGFARAQSGEPRRGLADLKAGRRVILRDGAEFAGPHVLGLHAAVCRDEEVLEETLQEAARLLEHNALSHNHLLFHPLAMLGIVRVTGGAPHARFDVNKHADALRDYAEPGARQWAEMFGAIAEGVTRGDVDEPVERALRAGLGIAHEFRVALRDV